MKYVWEPKDVISGRPVDGDVPSDHGYIIGYDARLCLKNDGPKCAIIALSDGSIIESQLTAAEVAAKLNQWRCKPMTIVD